MPMRKRRNFPTLLYIFQLWLEFKIEPWDTTSVSRLFDGRNAHVAT
jgi:hypothetical protein